MTSPYKRRARRSVGIALDELAEESRFGRSARREIIRWFPGQRWVKQLDADPKLREMVVIDRRSFLWTIGMLPAASLVAGCPADTLSLLFTAMKIASSLYGMDDPASGNALFTNNSQSREGFQLLTTLFAGKPESDVGVQDENDYEVNVPAMQDDYMHMFEDLYTAVSGDHFVSGQAIGETRDTNIFRYGK